MTELPAGWNEAPLDDLVAPSSHALAIGPFGSNLKVSDYQPSGTPLVFVRNIRARDFDLVPTFVSEQKATELAAHRVVPGDVLVTKMGDPPGDVAIYPAGRPQAILTADCIKATPHLAIAGWYLGFAIESPDCAGQIGEMTSGVAQQKISLEKIRRLRVPVAPQAEQQRIVAAIEEAFSKLDAGEAGLRTVRQLLRRMRDAVLAAAVTGRLVPQDPTDTSATKVLADLGVEPLQADLPAGWALTTVGDCFRVAVGATPSRKDPSLWGGDVPWVSSGEVAFNRIRETRETITARAVNGRSERILPAGTVLLAMIGEGKTRGQPAILDVAATHNQNCASIRIEGSGVLSEWVYTFLASRYEETRRAGSGNNQPALNKRRIEAIETPLPPAAEQRRIVDEVERQLSFVDACEGAIEAGLARSAGLRRSVLKAAFEGKLVPQDPSDEPASALLERIRASRAAMKPARRSRAKS